MFFHFSKIAIICLTASALISPELFILAISPTEERAQLEVELRELEQEIAQYDQEIKMTGQEKKTLDKNKALSDFSQKTS